MLNSTANSGGFLMGDYMSAKFKCNKAAVMRQMEKNKTAALEALGMEFTHHSMDEMDRLIYHAPLPPSTGANYTRTGRLRSGQSYQVERGDSSVVVGNNVDYSPHVHFPGITRNWDGRPWMTNTINSKQSELQAVAEAVLKRGFN